MSNTPLPSAASMTSISGGSKPHWRPHLSVRGRFFSTMIALIILIELVSGLVFHQHLSRWLSEQTIRQSAEASEVIAQQLIEIGSTSRFDSTSESHQPESHQPVFERILQGENSWLRRVSKTLDTRLTVISKRGTVIFDSVSSPNPSYSPALSEQMPEITSALEGELGISRRSTVRGEPDLIFVATPMVNIKGDVIGVVRLAKSSRSIEAQLNYLDRVILFVFGLSLALALLVSGWAARLLSQTLQRLVDLARDLSEGESNQEIDLTHQSAPDEYRTLARSLTKLATQIEDQVGRLADSRNRFEAVLDSMREGVIALDEEYQVSFANQSACKLLGWQTPPLSLHIDECIGEESLTLFLREQIAEEAPWVELEFHGRRIVLARLTPQSKRDEAVLVLNDITALKRLEAVRKDFVANVSHELRTPTTVIQANAETLLDGAIEDPQIARRFLEGIGRNAQRLAHLVSDLLDLSRIESGTYQMSAESVYPREVVGLVVDTLADQLIKKQIKVEIEVDESLEVLQDQGALEQVFMNLIENAVNYSEERGCVIIRATEDSSRLANDDQSLIRFEVIDDGPGISERHRPRIFERFYRVDKGRSRHLGGTGLGLAIVKHLCQVMGGEVGLESVEGEGCAFWFDVPRRAPHA